MPAVRPPTASSGAPDPTTGAAPALRAPSTGGPAEESPAERAPAGVRRHVVLVGLPGAGKSTVGPVVAEALGRPFLDLDAELERRAGMSVADLFAREGEGEFRRREAELSAHLRDADAMVLAPGGGWLENRSASACLRPVARLVYLRVSGATALARLGGALATRPLLAGSDPRQRLDALFARRAPLYAGADHVVEAEGAGPVEVAARVVEVVRTAEGGWGV